MTSLFVGKGGPAQVTESDGGGGSKSDEKSRYFFNLSVEKNLAAPQARKKS